MTRRHPGPEKVMISGAAVILGLGLAAVAVAAWGLGAGLPVTSGLLIGVLTAGLGSATWIVAARLARTRGPQAFLGAVLGGVVFRMFLYGGVMLTFGLLTSADPLALLLSMLGSHVLHQGWEITLLLRLRDRWHAPAPLRAGSAAVLGLLVALGAGLGTPLPVRAEGAGEGAHAQPGAPEHASPPAAGDEHGEAESSAAHGESGDAHGGGHEKFDVLHHIIDGRDIDTPLGVKRLPEGWMLGGIDFAPTKHVVWVWISAVAAFVFVLFCMRTTGTVSRGAGNALEALVVFIRDEIAAKNIAHHPEAFTPYLCSLFVFILFCNLAGLVPFGATATSNLNVTGALALLSLLMIQGSGIRQNGLIAHLKTLCPIPHGIPAWLLPLYVPIMLAVEIVGVFAKPIALALRLFANMTAGHVVILSLIGLIFILQTVLVAPVSVAFALFVYCLELFVGFVQAFIFTMLTALFIGMSQHPAH
jgi:F-type H+-transporting ATPase subunit a